MGIQENGSYFVFWRVCFAAKFSKTPEVRFGWANKILHNSRTSDDDLSEDAESKQVRINQAKPINNNKKK